MPYIKNQEREYFADFLKHLGRVSMAGPGELNYLITKLLCQYVATRSINYQAYNDMIGALEGAKLELYRRKIAEYENVKISENGDVF